MKIGYARVWTIEQNLDLPCDAFKAAGAARSLRTPPAAAKE
jgi:hypothetical protein